MAVPATITPNNNITSPQDFLNRTEVTHSTRCAASYRATLLVRAVR